MIVSKRKHFIGFHVTKSVRNRIRKEAEKQEISVSLFVYRALLTVLKMPDEMEMPLEELLKHE